MAAEAAANAREFYLDLEVWDQGSIIVVCPRTAAGTDWLNENCQAEAWQWIGGGLAMDWRCAEAVLNGAAEDGLSIA